MIDRDFPDAHVLAEDATYYAYATTDGRSNIQVARSRNLVDWELLDDGLPELPSWSGLSRLFGSTPQRATWAPEVVRVGDRFLMYYTAPALAREVASGIPAQCIGLAVSDTPEGPFRDTSGEPLVCYEEDGFSIDPSYFLDRDGAHYLLWRAGGRTGTWLQIQELSDDGSRLVGEPASTGVRNDQQWERFIVEAPTLVEKDGTYYLFYSGNDPFAAAYGVGYATADRVLGPYVKAEENPILASRAPAMGPGHQSVVVDGDGGLWLTYHAWDVAAIGYPAGRRALWIDELVIDDGKAEVRGPDAGPQALP